MPKGVGLWLFLSLVSIATARTGHSRLDLESCARFNFSAWWQLVGPCVGLRVEGEDPPSYDNVTCLSGPTGPLHANIEANITALARYVAGNATASAMAAEMTAAVEPSFRSYCPGNFSELVAFLRAGTLNPPVYLYDAPENVGVPLTNAMLCYFHAPEGKAFFEDAAINELMRGVVNAWADFLTSEESLTVFNEEPFGWRSPCAQAELKMAENFAYDPNSPTWGYGSWDEFFTRPLRPGARSISAPDDDRIVTAFGDVGPTNAELEVQLDNPLYVKNEVYSLKTMFAGNVTQAQRYVGGSVLQFFFSATSYHRYHSAVSGVVVSVRFVPGILYAVSGPSLEEDLQQLRQEPLPLDTWIDLAGNGLVDTQPYLAHVANRCILEVLNPSLGLVAQVFIGMTEISSCTLNKRRGDSVSKGDEIGMFRYGGSSGVIVMQAGHYNKSCAGGQFWALSANSPMVELGTVILNLTCGGGGNPNPPASSGGGDDTALIVGLSAGLGGAALIAAGVATYVVLTKNKSGSTTRGEPSAAGAAAEAGAAGEGAAAAAAAEEVVEERRVEIELSVDEPSREADQLSVE